MSKKIDVDDDLIRKLAGLMDDTGLTEIEIGQDDFTVRVARGGTVAAMAAPAPAPAGAAPVEAAPVSHAAFGIP